MVNIEKHARLLRVRADGQLSAEDYVDFAPQLDRLLDEGGAPLPIPVLVELGPELDGWRLYELWHEVEIDERHRHLFGPVAIVGDARWAVPARVADTVLVESVRFFDVAEKTQAEDWLRAQASSRAG